MSKNLNLTHAHLRRDYASDGLLEKQMKATPMQQFKIWFQNAVEARVSDANAFVLATVDSQTRPAARVLLMKGFNSKGITFFTNYGSAKGTQIKKHPFGEAVFFWAGLNRQVRLQGSLKKLSRNVSSAYFRSRPLLAQIAASASHQSRPITGRMQLEQEFELLKAKYQKKAPQMPAEWGGYQLEVYKAEFWQGRPSRLHDRICYQATAGRWKKVRLQP